MHRQVAKDLIIDSAAGWEYKTVAYRNKATMGYGIVSIGISKVLSTENNEIKFVLYGTSEAYKTTNYAIPIPKYEDDSHADECQSEKEFRKWENTKFISKILKDRG